MKIILLILAALLSSAIFANEEGMSLHNESCIACHIIQHDDDFYTQKERKITTLPKLGAQVTRCVQAFSIGWFPDEEASVVDYLNTKYYKFHP